MTRRANRSETRTIFAGCIGNLVQAHGPDVPLERPLDDALASLALAAARRRGEVASSFQVS